MAITVQEVLCLRRLADDLKLGTARNRCSYLLLVAVFQFRVEEVQRDRLPEVDDLFEHKYI